MNLQTYLAKKENQSPLPPTRQKCMECWQPTFACFCAHIKPIENAIKFVILIHPLEMRRRIATGRMAHLCLKNSELISGIDFSKNPRVQNILQDPALYPVVLHPRAPSVDISRLTDMEKSNYFHSPRRLVVFIVDGTWATARKMLRLSPNITSLPRICFTPTNPSNFRVRKQPKPECYSTIEAIHQTIELLTPAELLKTQRHSQLLDVFDWMVEKQLRYIHDAPEPAYRRVQNGK